MKLFRFNFNFIYQIVNELLKNKPVAFYAG
jgi:hypothetical protein